MSSNFSFFTFILDTRTKGIYKWKVLSQMSQNRNFIYSKYIISIMKNIYYIVIGIIILSLLIGCSQDSEVVEEKYISPLYKIQLEIMNDCGDNYTCVSLATGELGFCNSYISMDETNNFGLNEVINCQIDFALMFNERICYYQESSTGYFLFTEPDINKCLNLTTQEACLMLTSLGTTS